MLDGQTIVLDDYLLMRPENEEVLRKLIQSGRILIGPGIFCQICSSSAQKRISAIY